MRFSLEYFVPYVLRAPADCLLDCKHAKERDPSESEKLQLTNRMKTITYQCATGILLSPLLVPAAMAYSFVGDAIRKTVDPIVPLASYNFASYVGAVACIVYGVAMLSFPFMLGGVAAGALSYFIGCELERRIEGKLERIGNRSNLSNQDILLRI